MTNKKLTIFEGRLAEWEGRHPRVLFSGDAASLISHQVDKITDAQRQAADRIVVSQERGFDRVASEVERVYDGIEELGATFRWGFSELIWQAEQQSETLQKILEVLQAPLDTQGKELRKRAENAYANRWFDDALEDFLESEKKNKYDFVIHMSLGQIYFFEKKNLEKALEYYEKAAKYAAPESPQHASYALLHIGLINYLWADFQKAYKTTLKATKLSPNFAEAHFQCAQYSANLGKYDEAIEHLKKAVLGDRNYALKVWTEKDFEVMKQKLKSFFEQWRKKAHSETDEEIQKAKRLLSDVQSCDAGNTSGYIKAKKVLGQAEALLKTPSLFNCWDAIDEAITARELAWEAADGYLSEQANKIEQRKSEIERKGDQLRRRVNSKARVFGLVVAIAISIVVGTMIGQPVDVRIYTWFGLITSVFLSLVVMSTIIVGVALVAALLRIPLKSIMGLNQVLAKKKELDRQKKELDRQKTDIKSGSCTKYNISYKI